MHEAVEAFFRTHPEWAEPTCKTYRRWLTGLEQFFGQQGVRWDQARCKQLEAFRQELLWAGNQRGGLQSANTIYQALRLIRAFYAWAHAQKLSQSNPMHDWVLPRPANRPTPTPLSRTQVLSLFHLPDLSQPAGQRDLVLLQLLYHGWPLLRCRTASTELPELPDDGDLAAVLELYLRAGRPALNKANHFQLILTDAGHPFKSLTGLTTRLTLYRKRLAWPELNARLLRLSGQQHQADLAHGRFTL